jgi:hypothetical protein
LHAARIAQADRKRLMARTFPALAFLFAGMLAASPAAAQFPNIFDSIFGAPPRPPSDIPSRPPLEPPSRDAPLPPGPPPGPPRGSYPGPPPGGRIQTQPLQPPPGALGAPPPAARAPQPSLPGLPPGQRQPRPPSGTAALQPSDEVVVEPPTQKIPNPTAVFSGLDKITGRIISFDVSINETVRFGALEVTPRACYTRPATETPNTDSFIEVDELTLQGELRRIFTGWMFASSPGLNAVEHPIYDIWLTDCKGAAPPAVTVEVAPEPQAPPQRPARGQQQRGQQQQQQQQQRRATQQPLPPPPLR